ncbi:MAG: YabP/YqfC family sporulation protein [Erysipelotrichales bacterium]|nr:YabP/YqfC family sporulation protein [Erysipelotrichales bacterium]
MKLKNFKSWIDKLKPVNVKLEIREDMIVVYNFKKIHILTDTEIQTTEYRFTGEGFSVKELNKEDLIISGKIKVIEVGNFAQAISSENPQA